MKIAIDRSPLESGHKVRGVGFYLTHLLQALKEYFPENTYIEFSGKSKLPIDTDLVHYPYFDPFSLTFPLRLKFPTVITIHDLIPLKFPGLFPIGKKGQIKWQIQKRIAKNADAIITDSENSKKDIHELLSIPVKKIHVVYLAAGSSFKVINMSEEEKNTIIKKYNLPENFVLYVGDVTPNKNISVLVDAIKEINVPLVLVGKSLASTDYDHNHPWNRELVNVHENTKGNHLFKFLGFVETNDLVKLYNMCSLFVMPSFYEGFGLPLIEAMSCGVPTVTTSESSLNEVGGDAPLYADYKSKKSFAENILKIMNDDSLAKEMAKKSLIQSKKFSWENTARKTVAVYKTITEK